jgi:hypothetical protein
MGALDMVSCGMVDLTTASERDRRAIQTAVKFEAHAKGYWISGCKSVGCCTTMAPTYLAAIYLAAYWPERGGPHRLTRWNKKTFRNHSRPTLSQRTAPIKVGNFVECCRALTAIITPSDHEET